MREMTVHRLDDASLLELIHAVPDSHLEISVG